ncbi:MAG: radical SAM protein [Desulfovibrionaceae bacterium]
MDILLINPFHEQPLLYNFPWGVLSVGSYLTSKGYDVTLLDASSIPDERFRAELDAALGKTRLVGIGCFSTDVDFVKDIVDHIKARDPGILVMLGGPHAVLNSESTAAYPNVDVVVYGYGEEPTEALIEQVRAGRRDFAAVNGILYRENGQVVRTAPCTDTKFYDTDFSLLPESRRVLFKKHLQLLAGRGCSFKCAFCYNAICGQKWAGRSAEDVVAEIEKCVALYDPDVIYFRDENFFHSKKRIYRFIELYKEKGFRFRWEATCRANYFRDSFVNDALLVDLEAVHCAKLKFGIESGSQRVLDYLKKGTTLNEIRRVVNALAKVSITGNYSFLMGVPGETRAEYVETVKLIRYILDVDPHAEIIGPQYYRIYPGGEIYDEIVRDFGIEEPKTFEEWGERSSKDDFGFGKNIEHPWIREGDWLAKYSDVLVLLYRKQLRELLTPLKCPAIPFALLAKMRMRLGWFGMLVDIKLAHALFKRYVKVVREG